MFVQINQKLVIIGRVEETIARRNNALSASIIWNTTNLQPPTFCIIMLPIVVQDLVHSMFINLHWKRHMKYYFNWILKYLLMYPSIKQ